MKLWQAVRTVMARLTTGRSSDLTRKRHEPFLGSWELLLALYCPTGYRMMRAVLGVLSSVAPGATGAEVQYFPDLALAEKAELHQLRAEWYSQHLRAMNEPSLLEARNDGSSHIYRFLWLRTFDHPIALRLRVRPEGDGVLTVRVLNGMGGYGPGRVRIKRTVDVNSDRVSSFLESLEKIGFWRLTGSDPSWSQRARRR